MSNVPERPSADYVRMFDTTLRDGEQSPGATLTSAEKIEVARALSRLGVDVIEAGFPAASPDDLVAVRNIAASVGVDPVDGRPSREPPIICGLARASEGDIDKAWDGIKDAKYPRIHTFLATSPIHREHKLKLTREQVVERITQMVSYAKKLCDDVEFSPEDAGRTEPEFLWEALSAAVAAGATTLNIPDTVGYTMPDEFGRMIRGIRENVKGIEDVIISVHCHNDLGLATANTLAGIANGARQAEVTMNGIGERAGNTAIEEVVMALETRRALFGLKTGVDSTQLCRTSKLVSTRTGMVVQPNKAVVGANAFAHEAGIHQDGMLKHEETYEIMRPETVGATESKLVLGKHSGKHAFGVRLKELGHPLSGDVLLSAFERFKKLADKKKVITDADLEALVASEVPDVPEVFALVDVQVSTGTSNLPTATVKLRGPDGVEKADAQVGNGPVDALFRAVNSIVQPNSSLVEFNIHAITEGVDALGEVSVRIRAPHGRGKANPQHQTEDRIFHGHYAHSDVMVASVKAYLNALNKMLTAQDAAAEPGLRAVGATP